MNGHRKTCRRDSEPGHAHSLTFSCFCWRPFLSKDRGRLWLVEAIDRARQKHAFDLWAYVSMPEQLHLPVWPRHPRYAMSQMLTSMKQSVSMKALSNVRRSAPVFLSRIEDRQRGGQIHDRFWQRGGGYDRHLEHVKRQRSGPAAEIVVKRVTFNAKRKCYQHEPNQKRSGPRSTTSMQAWFGGDSVKLRQRGRGHLLPNTNVPAAASCASIDPLCHTHPSLPHTPQGGRHAHAKPWAWHPALRPRRRGRNLAASPYSRPPQHSLAEAESADITASCSGPGSRPSSPGSACTTPAPFGRTLECRTAFPDGP